MENTKSIRIVTTSAKNSYEWIREVMDDWSGLKKENLHFSVLEDEATFNCLYICETPNLIIYATHIDVQIKKGLL